MDLNKETSKEEFDKLLKYKVQSKLDHKLLLGIFDDENLSFTESDTESNQLQT